MVQGCLRCVNCLPHNSFTNGTLGSLNISSHYRISVVSHTIDSILLAFIGFGSISFQPNPWFLWFICIRSVLLALRRYVFLNAGLGMSLLCYLFSFVWHVVGLECGVLGRLRTVLLENGPWRVFRMELFNMG